MSNRQDLISRLFVECGYQMQKQADLYKIGEAVSAQQRKELAALLEEAAKALRDCRERDQLSGGKVHVRVVPDARDGGELLGSRPPLGPDSKPVAWAVQLKDGTIGLPGWFDMSSYEAIKKVGILREGACFVFAYQTNAHDLSQAYLAGQSDIRLLAADLSLRWEEEALAIREKGVNTPESSMLMAHVKQIRKALGLNVEG